MLSPQTFYKLPKTIFWYQLVKLAIITALVSLLGLASSSYFKTFFALFVLIGIPVIIYKTLKYTSIEFSIDDKSITINKGILNKQISTLPFSNIQNVKLKGGPLLRVFGLTNIYIWTASREQKKNNADGFLRLGIDDALEVSGKILGQTNDTNAFKLSA